MAVAAAMLPNLERLTKDELVVLLNASGTFFSSDPKRWPKKKRLADMLRNSIMDALRSNARPDSEPPLREVPITMDPSVASLQ
jgi:hypothetical protein